MKKIRLAIIGGGNMGACLLSGLIANDYTADQFWVADPNPDVLERLKQQYHVQVTTDNNAAIAQADVVILAIKPQAMKNVLQTIAQGLRKNQSLIISIAAGIRASTISSWLGAEAAIVRCMPNTPALIGYGASALYANQHVLPSQRIVAEDILKSVGIVSWLDDEKMLDTVTALSGSGPAYFFLMMEALKDAAIDLGLSADVAQQLTTQTARGAAQMALQSTQPLAELRRQVTSPGGTTERAIKVLEEANLKKLLASAVKAAHDRSIELATMLDKTEF